MKLKTETFAGHSIKKVTYFIKVTKKGKKYSAPYYFSTKNGGGSGSITFWREITEALKLYGIKAITIDEPIECRFLLDLLFKSNYDE